MAVNRNSKPIVPNIRAVAADAKASKNIGDLADAVSKLAVNSDDALNSIAKMMVALHIPYSNQVSSPEGLLIHPSHLSPDPLARAVFPVATVTEIAAVGNMIFPGATYVRLSNTSGGSLTLTSAPTIMNGLPQQYLVLYNIGANNIVLQDQGTLAGSNLRLAATTRTLAPRQSISLLYSTDIGDWLEQYYSAVI